MSDDLSNRPDDPYEFMLYLHKRYYPFMRVIAAKTLNDWPEADSVANAVMFTLMRKADRLMTLEDEQLKAYIARAAHNAAVDTLRARTQEVECVPLESVEHLPAQTVEPEPFEFDPDQIEWLKDWDYKPIQVRLISMVYYEGYSLQEAAELSRVTYANARQIISRAFRQIRKLYPEGYKGRVGRKR